MIAFGNFHLSVHPFIRCLFVFLRKQLRMLFALIGHYTIKLRHELLPSRLAFIRGIKRLLCHPEPE